MKVLKWLKTFLCRKNTQEQDSEYSEEGVRELLSLSHHVYFPADLMEALLPAIALDTLSPVVLNSLDEIKAYEMIDLETKEFMCTFYALKVNDTYYGAIVGHNKIIAVKEKAFVFRKTNEVVYSLNVNNCKDFVLICKLVSGSSDVNAVRLEKKEGDGKKRKVCLRFPEGVSFDKAIQQSFEAIPV